MARIPKSDKAHFLFEIKPIPNDKSAQEIAKAALKQIVGKDYAQEACATLVARIRAIGLTVDGKQAVVESQVLND